MLARTAAQKENWAVWSKCKSDQIFDANISNSTKTCWGFKPSPGQGLTQIWNVFKSIRKERKDKKKLLKGLWSFFFFQWLHCEPMWSTSHSCDQCMYFFFFFYQYPNAVLCFQGSTVCPVSIWRPLLAGRCKKALNSISGSRWDFLKWAKRWEKISSGNMMRELVFPLSY